MTAKTFERGRGRTTFACSLCGRMTRDTDQGGTDLCMDCYELCSMDNEINDGGRAPTAAELKRADGYVRHIRAKGGQAAKVIGFCQYLFPGNAKEPVDTTFAADPVTVESMYAANAPKPVKAMPLEQLLAADPVPPPSVTAPMADATESGATFIRKNGLWVPLFRGPCLELAKRIAAAEVKGHAEFRWVGTTSRMEHEFKK